MWPVRHIEFRSGGRLAIAFAPVAFLVRALGELGVLEAAEFGRERLAERVPIDPSAQAPGQATSICSERSLKNS